MSQFLKEKVQWKSFDLLIDTKVFPKDIILKSAYNFLDLGYFFFRFDSDQNIILEFTYKEGVDKKAETIIWEFSDGMLDVYLRDKLEKDNKVIREAIVEKAINGPLDMQNFVTLDTDASQKNEVDFDKDIDEILKEIENDPDLKIDEEEIENILKEIEEESVSDNQKPSVQADPSVIADMKNKFKKK